MVLFTGCNKSIEQPKEEKPIEEEPVIEIEDPYVDDNPIIVGLYDDRKLTPYIKANRVDNADVAVLTAYFTNEEVLSSSSGKYNYNKYSQNYENIDKYKIGYYISFTCEGEKYESMILDPSTMYVFSPYMYIYLYDDVHQPDGAWYSHVEMDDIKDETLYTSIKLYLVSAKMDYIDLTVFTYDSEDDFDSDGYYRGNSKYQTRIEFN